MGRVIYVALFVATAVFYYYLLGTGPTPSEILELPWWRPRGWALRWESLSGLAALAEEEGPARVVPVLLFSLPPLALMGLGFGLFRSGAARVLLLALGTSLCAFSYYGLLAPGIWRFFSWRWPALIVLMSLTIWGLVLAPSLMRDTLRLPIAARVLALLVAAAAIFLPSVEVTGTDFELSLNISPWPVITMFGFLLFGYIIAALHAAVGLGAFLRSALRGPASIASGILLAGALAGLAPLLIFSDPTVGRSIGLGLAGALGACITLGSARSPEGAASRGRFHVGAAALVAALIYGSDQWAVWDQTRNRDRVAPPILDALEQYYEKNEVYPDDLEDLAPTYVAAIPTPRIGMIRHAGEQFLYTNLGDSYVLEFACAKWVQCAYSPPYRAGYPGADPNSPDPNAGAGAAAPDVAAGEEESLEGAWSCEPRPPELW
jgi:hypothetical protein